MAAAHSTRQTKARKRALDILFEAELRARSVLETLDDRVLEASPVVREFTIDLVRGVHQHKKEIDSRIRQAVPKGWSLERMPRVDRNLARIAVYEIDYSSTPGQVAISEAVALASELSTDESPSFLNGLLAKVLATRLQTIE